jgi:hypothetical protein
VWENSEVKFWCGNDSSNSNDRELASDKILRCQAPCRLGGSKASNGSALMYLTCVHVGGPPLGAREGCVQGPTLTSPLHTFPAQVRIPPVGRFGGSKPSQGSNTSTSFWMFLTFLTCPLDVFGLVFVLERLPRVLRRVVSKILPSHHPYTLSLLRFKPPPSVTALRGSVKNIRSKTSQNRKKPKWLRFEPSFFRREPTRRPYMCLTRGVLG